MFRNNCKHNADIQNINKYEYLLRYQIKYLLKCTTFSNVMSALLLLYKNA